MPDIPLPKPAAPASPQQYPTGNPSPLNGPLPGEEQVSQQSVSPLPGVASGIQTPAQPSAQNPVQSTPSPSPLSPNPMASPNTVPNTNPAPTPSTLPAPGPVALPPASVGALSSLSSNALPGSGQGNSVADAHGSPPPQTPPPGSSSPSQPKPKPQFASAGSPLKKFLPFIIGGVVLLLVGVFVVMQLFGGGGSSSVSTGNSGGTGSTTTPGSTTPTQNVTLEYWGLWEPTEVMESVISDYEAANPGVQVRYTKQSHRDYRERLQTAIASGNGPDLFRFHATWSSMLKNELAAMPSTVYSSTEYQETFYPVVTKQLQVDGQYVGVPIMYDGLALYYNKKMFETAGVEVPTTWSELRVAAKTLTLTSGNTIERGGVALGSAKNVDHFSDVLGYLMVQNGADLKKPDSAETRDAISFYTNFVRMDKVWSETLPSSTVAFAREDVAMMFAPSWRAHEILAMNPDLDFATAPLPKLGNEDLGWANYWAEGVNSKSQNKQATWNFIKYLSSKEVQQKLYSEQSKIRPFGEIYSRVDLANELVDAPYVEAYLQDAPQATGWYVSSNTFDKGINDQLIKYYEDAVNASVQGKNVDQILQTLELGTTQVLRQYNATGS